MGLTAILNLDLAGIRRLDRNFSIRWGVQWLGAARVTSRKAGAGRWTVGRGWWHSNAMGERIQIPNIPEEARTPLVKGLVDVIEQLVQKVRQQEEKSAQLYRHPAYDVC